MDFIGPLPESEDRITRNKFNIILIVVDRLTKYSHFILTKNTLKADELMNLYLDRIVRHHGIPKEIILDRDRLFISGY